MTKCDIFIIWNVILQHRLKYWRKIDILLVENENQPFFVEEYGRWRKAVSRFWRKMEPTMMSGIYFSFKYQQTKV